MRWWPRQSGARRASRFISALSAGMAISIAGGILTAEGLPLIGISISVVGVIIGLLTLCFVVYDVRRPERRVKKLRNPASAFFVIPNIHHHDCSYAYQDDFEHVVKRIVLPAHTDVVVDFAIIPKLDFHTTSLIITCDGNNDVKPRIIEIFNRFIEVGSRRNVIPGHGNSVDYIDKYWSFHVVENSQWSIGTTRALGFKIRTGAPGTYPIPIYFIGDTIEGSVAELSIKVCKCPMMDRMYCVDAKHHARGCVVGINLKPT